jgi:hypothetical protein
VGVWLRMAVYCSTRAGRALDVFNRKLSMSGSNLAEWKPRLGGGGGGGVSDMGDKEELSYFEWRRGGRKTGVGPAQSVF